MERGQVGNHRRPHEEPFTREGMLKTYQAQGGEIAPELLGIEVCYSCSDGGRQKTAELEERVTQDEQKIRDLEETQGELLELVECCGDPGDCGHCGPQTGATPPLRLDWGPRSGDVLEEGRRLVYTEREGSYGPPEATLRRIGRVWGALLELPDIPPEKVAELMVGLKMARQVHSHKRDNLVDAAGYLELADRARS